MPATSRWNPHITVAAVIESGGRYLMVEEDIDGRAVLNQPAGHLEEGEGLVDAVIRETLEETAGRFVPEAVVGIYRWRAPRQGVTFLRVCFTGHCTGFEAGRALDEGVIGTVWLSRGELAGAAGRLRSPLVQRCIDDHAAGRRYPLQLLSDVPD